MPRNCYRGDASKLVFSLFDPLALDVALTAMEHGIPDQPEIRWQFVYRMWFTLPLEHSEDLSVHARCLKELQGFSADTEALIASPDAADAPDSHRAEAARVLRERAQEARQFAGAMVSFEEKHMAIVKEFGRYPHRNRALGRATTSEEKAYLDNGGETFGG